MILLSASKVWLWVQRDGVFFFFFGSFLTWTRSHLSLQRHRDMSLEVVEVETLLILQENLFDPSNWVIPNQGGCSQFLISSNKFYSSICDWKYGCSIFFGKYHFLCIESFWVDSDASNVSSSSMSVTIMSPSQIPPRTECIQGTIQVILSWHSTNEPNGMIGPLKRFSKTPFVWSLPIRQEIWNVSQIGIAFHGICSPILIQTWLQQCCRRTFFHSAHCSFTNLIRFPSVWYWRTMIPGKIFTGLAKFQGIVSVNYFRLPNRLQELMPAPLCFLRSFCFVRIRLDPLGSQVARQVGIASWRHWFRKQDQAYWTLARRFTWRFCWKKRRRHLCQHYTPPRTRSIVSGVNQDHFVTSCPSHSS